MEQWPRLFAQGENDKNYNEMQTTKWSPTFVVNINKNSSSLGGLYGNVKLYAYKSIMICREQQINIYHLELKNAIVQLIE